MEKKAEAELLLITGLLIAGVPDSEIVAGSLRSAEQWRLEHEVLDTADLALRFSTFAPDPDTTRVPALTGRFLRAAPCMYTNTPDEHFVVGPHPRHPQVVVAAGFCGHGFKFAPVIGEIVADLTVAGTTAHPIGLFDPARFG